MKSILVLLFGCYLMGMDVPVQAQSLTLIAHAEGAPDEVRFKKVQDIFKADHQRWSNGTKIVLAMVKSSNPIAPVVADKVYEMDVDGVKKYWVQIVFRGKASTPKYFDTEEEVRQYVTSTPGAIGIISAGMADSTARIVKVGGENIW